MRIQMLAAAMLGLMWMPVAVWGQDTPAEPAEKESAAADQKLDEVSREAGQLEAELGKHKDTSPEAAEIMIKLVDMYHQTGRPFGLIRNGQRFISNHAQHEQHAAVMVKLIEGLQATSRNKDIVATVRQFLLRYPENEACPRFEVLLARTLAEMNQRDDAAAAYVTIWRRDPKSQTGKNALVSAIQHYAASGSKNSWIKASELGDEALDIYPAGQYISDVGWQAVSNWQRAGEYAKSIVTSNKMLKAGLPKEKHSQRQLHLYMAENYTRLGQRTNAVDSLRKARAIEDSATLHARTITEMYYAAVPGAQVEQEVNRYFQAYPEQENRFSLKTYAAMAYQRDKEDAKALALMRELLPFDAYTNSIATHFVRLNGTEPDKMAESEKVLLDALKKNSAHAAYIRWALGFELYRDRMKDVAKAKLTIRDLVNNSPTNDNTTQQAIYWLLSSIEDEAELKSELTRMIRTRDSHFEVRSYTGYLRGWVAQVKRSKDWKDRAAVATQMLDASETEHVKTWLTAFSGGRAEYEGAMEKLLEAPEKLNDAEFRWVVESLAYSYYRYNRNNDRSRAADLYGKLSERFPEDYNAASQYLTYSSSYSTPEVAREAALNMLKFEPQQTSNDYEVWYRLIGAGDRSQDKDLLKKAHDWVLKAQDKFGIANLTYADSIGDMLTRHEMTDEALAYWKKCIPVDYNSYYSRRCAERVLALLEGDARTKFLQDLVSQQADYHGTWAMYLAGDALTAGDLDSFEKILAKSHEIQLDRPFHTWGIEDSVATSWVSSARANKELDEASKLRIFNTVADLDLIRSSAAAQLARLEIQPEGELDAMQRLLKYQETTFMVGDSSTDWDVLMAYAQAAMARKDYVAVATLTSGMLSNVTSADNNRKQAGRDMVGQSYARMGAVGLAIDDTSPIAPLLQAALYLRLGDKQLAFDAYMANQKLFDAHREELPVDLILFVCESHIAAGGEDNHNRVEDILRGWLVKFSEAKDLDDAVKARVQLLLAKNYYQAQRYDIARSEYTTVKNRYPDTPQAVEAEFGIGESFMAQKVYDQAEAVFEALANSNERDIVIRAEFLRGVLANRRGDRDEARDIFRSVLEMVPNIQLANEALFNLSEVYAAEERYMDQLELLRTVGRLGRESKRWHTPGVDLSIVVYDPDLNVSKGNDRIPVLVTTMPGGDTERVTLYATAGGKGLFRADLPTNLGEVSGNDKVLQLTGNDVIYCDYPEDFKARFRSVPLSDAEIRVAANAEFDVSSSKIEIEEAETLSDRIAREEETEDEDERVSEQRPTNQIKPGNLVYLRVEDPDRDLSDGQDEIIVKLTATSGDQVQAKLQELEAHSGVFEGTAQTAELPAGALASDTAIDHNPLMAIDQDQDTFWLSEPNGATPKWLSVDMKDLRYVDRVNIRTPDPTQQVPVRGDLMASHDGRFWFRLGSIPPQLPVEQVAGEFEAMTRRVYAGNFTNYTTWQQIVDLSKNSQPIEEAPADNMEWGLPAELEEENPQLAHGVLWHGKIVQPRSGAMRISLNGLSAVVVDGQLELPVATGARTVDVWLDGGTHDLTVFSATTNAQANPITVLRAREDHNAEDVVLAPFVTSDFDLSQPGAKAPLPRKYTEVNSDNGVWDFRFDPYELRYVKLVVHEYLGEAVAINHIEITGEDGAERHIPTQADVLSLAENQVLEIAAGDIVTAAYNDEYTRTGNGRSQLLTKQLTATYYNAKIAPIGYEFVRQPNGAVVNLRKQLIRIEPGEKFIIEVTDYDHDRTAEPDSLRLQVAVNDGEPIDLIAQETEPNSGIFTKEVETSDKPEPGKLQVKQGDRIYCSFVDAQNTFPGHAVPRETVVYVNEPSDGRINIVESRVSEPPVGSTTPRRVVYLPGGSDKEIAHVAFEAPLAVVVYDRDAAKDDRSKVVVTLETTDGATVDVECVVSSEFAQNRPGQQGLQWALEEGRFVGQIILQLGSKASESLVPLTSEMPRNLIGGPVFTEDEMVAVGNSLVTKVLNLTGKDIISATYNDAQRVTGQPQDLDRQARLISNGVLTSTERDYQGTISQLHVGEKLFMRVDDADLDTSDERDFAEVKITSDRGESEIVRLEETLAHSGVFSGSVMLKPSETPTPDNINLELPVIEAFFGDSLKLEYVDANAATESGELVASLDLPVVIGTDGLVSSFTKTFSDENLAVETQFHIAESYFELFKSHKKLERSDELKTDLEAGRRVLREVMEDYPDPKYVPRIAYLLGQFAQELQQWDEAIESYQLIVRRYGEHPLAPDAQYKLAQSYEEAGDFDEALEAYVTLAATYPKSPLIANVMIRISDRFYRNENYEVAAQVGKKFLERFEGHEWASRMAFRVGQCYYKAEKFREAGTSFDEFAEIFPDDALCSDAIFWSGESYRMGKNNQEAFRRYNVCRWKFPASEAAKYARGRLALPEMLAEFERAAADLDDQ